MLLKIKVPTETFATNMACIRLLVIVGVHMKGQVVHLVEGFRTYITFVLLFCAVGQLVVLVVSFLMEAFAAELAHVRLVALVDAHVRVQCGASIESFPTSRTFVRFL